jgi:hypothetical protein
LASAKLDPPVALFAAEGDLVQQFAHRPSEPYGHAGHHPLGSHGAATALPAQEIGSADAPRLELGVQHGRLEGRLGHVVPFHAGQGRAHRANAGDAVS